MLHITGDTFPNNSLFDLILIMKPDYLLHVNTISCGLQQIFCLFGIRRSVPSMESS